MKRDCSTCICKEGSCYPSTTIFDKDKNCKSYAPDYEGYIAELEQENERLRTRCEQIRDEGTGYMQLLEQENAELRGLVNQYKASKCGSISLVNRNMIMFDQLTNAKEIIKRYVKIYVNPYPEEEIELRNEAEQFLNSEVEK